MAVALPALLESGGQLMKRHTLDHGKRSALGRRTEAKPLRCRAPEAFERTLGAEHPSTARALGNLADMLCALGGLGEEEHLQRGWHGACERTPG